MPTERKAPRWVSNVAAWGHYQSRATCLKLPCRSHVRSSSWRQVESSGLIAHGERQEEDRDREKQKRIEFLEKKVQTTRGPKVADSDLIDCFAEKFGYFRWVT